MTNFKKLIIVALAVLPMLSLSAQKITNKEAAEKLRYAEAYIDNFYVDSVDADTIVEEAIRAMLKTLDPHSSYSTAQETKELNEPLQGKFSGIGIQFNMSTDTVYVLQTTPGGPCEKVGIRPGDRIISANDTVIAGKKLTNNQIVKTLRGPKGSKVKLMIKRGNSPDLIEFIVTRDDIPINSVDAVYMVTPEIGYISLTRFAEDSGKEVADAIKKLQKQGMTKLILDLQDNGGGYLSSAVDIASLFLDHDDLVVYTEGRQSPKYEYNVRSYKPLFDGELVVLINQYSASASEIVSGAIQDNDRGTIVGRRSYGKGLVQRPLPFPDGSMIRLTISRYYTPAGRCIQKHYEKGHSEDYARDLLDRYESGELWSADSIHFDESQKYRTLKKGRTVYGGGGIMPDIFVPLDTTLYSPYYRDLNAKSVIATYVLKYIDNNRKQLLKKYPNEDKFYTDFEVSDTMLDELFADAEAAGVTRKEEGPERSLPLIKAIIKGLLARDLYVDGNYMRSTNPLNPIFVEGVKALRGKTTSANPTK